MMNFLQNILLLATLIFTLFFALIGCKTQDPIKIGFVGTFSGRHYDLGISGRNGALLAVDEANEKGGLLGRKIELIVKDDKNDPEVAIKADRELIDQGVIAIIGHMTSGMSKAALPLINEKKVVMISPTAASPIFEGIDDYFIRINISLKEEAKKIASFAFSALKLRKIAVFYDISNKTYSEEWISVFKSEFEKLGGRTIPIEFNSTLNPSFSELTYRALISNPHGIVIVANAFDTANLCQQLRKNYFYKPVFSSLWGMTSDLFRHGGKAVENLTFSHIYNPDDTNQEYLTFKKKYIQRFGREPDFAALKAYEAVNVLLSSIRNPKDLKNLKKAILEKKRFRGLQREFEIDEYGDVKNNILLITIKKGTFVFLNHEGKNKS